MTIEIPVTQAREELAELINRVAYGHERIVLTRHSKPVAGIVPPEDLAWLEQRSQETITLGSAGPALDRRPLSAAPDVLPMAAQHGPPPGSPEGAPPGSRPPGSRPPGH
jgi:prevent-host-death family protein